MEAAGPDVAMEELWKAHHPTTRLPQLSHNHLENAAADLRVSHSALENATEDLRVSHSSHSPGGGWDSLNFRTRTPENCYPCCRSKVLPMTPVVHSLGGGNG